MPTFLRSLGVVALPFMLLTACKVTNVELGGDGSRFDGRCAGHPSGAGGSTASGETGSGGAGGSVASASGGAGGASTPGSGGAAGMGGAGSGGTPCPGASTGSGSGGAPSVSCTIDNDCGPDEDCLAMVCRSRCDGNCDCPTGQVCADFHCAP